MVKNTFRTVIRNGKLKNKVVEVLKLQTAIFYYDNEQLRIAEASKKTLNESGRFKTPVVTQILPAMPFYPAEDS